MPCSLHNASNIHCVNCFIEDLLSIDPEGLSIRTETKRMEERFLQLRMVRIEDIERCYSAISSANWQLLKVGFGGNIKSQDAEEKEIQWYRERILDKTIWPGIAEFSVLSEIFGISFNVALPTVRKELRLFKVGPKESYHLGVPVLRWADGVYDICTIRPLGASRTICGVGSCRPVNRGSDSGLEAFMLLLSISDYWKVCPDILSKKNDGAKRRLLVAQMRELAVKNDIVNMQLYMNKLIRRDEKYEDIIGALRSLIASNMGGLFNHAIHARKIFKRFDRQRQQQFTWQGLMNVEEARELTLSTLGKKTTVNIGIVDGGFDESHSSLNSVMTVHNDSGDMSHGTLCAGVLVGIEDTKKGFLGGLARSTYPFISHLHAMAYDNNSGAAEDLELCRKLVQDHGVVVISMSFGTTGEKIAELGDLIKKGRTPQNNQNTAKFGNCVFVVAAGNEPNREKNFLVLGQNAIVVTSTGLFDESGIMVEKITQHCSHGLGVTLCAPGGDLKDHRTDLLKVKSPDVTPKNMVEEDFIGNHSNTSAATPMVAGVVALMLAINPALTHEEVKLILCLTATKLDPLGGGWQRARTRFNRGQVHDDLLDQDYSVHYGFGRIDALAALREVIRRMNN